ncbi:MAG TPA: hypothetical protein VD770_03205 [Coxiellaceae bacterium]|nr:hypothetical protein [Coxiellaceae bacterium]
MPDENENKDGPLSQLPLPPGLCIGSSCDGGKVLFFTITPPLREIVADDLSPRSSSPKAVDLSFKKSDETSDPGSPKSDCPFMLGRDRFREHKVCNPDPTSVPRLWGGLTFAHRMHELFPKPLAFETPDLGLKKLMRAPRPKI